MPFEFVTNALEVREKQKLLRRVKVVSAQHQGLIEVDGQFLINFAGNDYLGMSHDQDVLQSYTEGLAAFGASSSASPVVCGYHQAHQRLESKVAELTGAIRSGPFFVWVCGESGDLSSTGKPESCQIRIGEYYR